MTFTIYDLRFAIGASGRFVAPIFNRLYRRFTIGWASDESRRTQRSSHPQNTILRYGRFQICATLTFVGAGLFWFSALSADTLLLTNATIHTVSGATIARGDVLIQDGKIKGVFAASQPSRPIYPSAATKIDLKGLHLYPGMIALNTDLGLVEI